MPIIFEPILSILVVIGFYFIGRLISLKLKFDKILSFISNPHYQFTIIGIVFFLYFLFPFFLFGFLPKEIFYLFYIISFYGLLNILVNYKKIYSSVNKITKSLKQSNKNNLFIFFILFTYFLLSLAPPTSADSLFYHLSDAKKIFMSGSLYSNELDFHGKLSGIGEFLNAFAVSIKAYQFTSLIHFVGLLSTIGVIRKFSSDQKIKESNVNFIILIVLSTPVLLALVSQSKPQLFYSSVIFLCYSFILFLLTKEKKKFNNIIKIIIISNILLTVCVNAKLNFLLSFGIINSFFVFFLIKKNFLYKINFQKIFYFFLIIIFGLLPFIIWKSFVYDYPFYFFLINPLPLNIPHMVDFFEFLKNYGSEKFPWIIFFPTNFGDTTRVLGLGIFLLLFIIKSKLQHKKTILFIIIFYIISLSILGQKSPRFYYEIYLFIILVSTLIFNKIIKLKYFSYFKILIYLQSFCIISALIFSALFLFPGSLNAKLKHQVQSKFADGYSLIFWVNSLLPKDTVVLVTQRSTFLFNNLYVNPEPLGYMTYDSEYKNYYLTKIKEKKPTFVIFNGHEILYNIGEFDFENCISGLYAEKLNVGSLKTRNPFNSNKNLYNGYIYYFDYKKLPDCVQRANIEN